jgi:pimeloyl-ACP methyl ester carboxylesterase
MERSEFVAPDGVRLSTLRWPGSGPPLYLMHATGFCAQMWEPIARALADVASPRAMDARGHGESGKPDGEYPWGRFSDDLVAWVRSEGGRGVSALGHSSGATAVALAAAREPALFRAILLVDPVLLRPRNERDEDEKRGGFGLAERTERRRGVFPSRDAIRQAYETRFPFSAFDPEIFELYIDHAVHDRGNGEVELACPPEIERRVYLGTAAVDPWEELPKIRARVRIIVPELTGIRPELQERLRKTLPRAEIVRVPGTHFVALERPALVAEEARALLG